MSRVMLPPLAAISRDIPDDLTVDTENVLARLKTGVHDLLLDQACKCVGQVSARNSVASNLASTFRALAVGRHVDISIKEVAIQRGADAEGPQSAFATYLTSDQIQSLLAYVGGTITDARIIELVPDKERAALETQALAKVPGIRDPGWKRDISDIVNRIIGHPVAGWVSTPTEENPTSGMYVVQTLAVKLDTLIAEVDDNGEICCWTYEEPVI